MSKTKQEPTKAQRIAELKAKSFDDEIQDGANTIVEYLNRGDKVQELLSKENISEQEEKSLTQEKATIDLYKRMLLMMASGGLMIKNGSKERYAADNKLPVCAYLNSGSRVLIKLPDDPLVNEEFIKWFSSGKDNQSNISKKFDKNEALNE